MQQVGSCKHRPVYHVGNIDLSCPAGCLVRGPAGHGMEQVGLAGKDSCRQHGFFMPCRPVRIHIVVIDRSNGHRERRLPWCMRAAMPHPPTTYGAPHTN